MGLFVNPDQSAFQSALNAQIYVDKSGLIEYTNSVLESTDLSATVVRAGLENRLRRIC